MTNTTDQATTKRSHCEWCGLGPFYDVINLGDHENACDKRQRYVVATHERTGTSGVVDTDTREWITWGWTEYEASVIAADANRPA